MLQRTRVLREFFLLAIVLCFAGFLGFDFSFSQAPKKAPDLDAIPRIARSVFLIQHEYYDPSRIKPREIIEEGLFELAKDIPEALPKFSKERLFFAMGSEELEVDLSGIKNFYDILEPLATIFAFIDRHYKGNVKPEDREYSFIAGMLATLDPHSAILTPKVFEDFKAQTSGQYGGLGIVIGEKDNNLTIIAPMEDTPAWRAGIQADDMILQIGDQSTANMPLTDAVDLMRGEPKTQVTLKIQTKGQEPRDLTLTREIISIQSVQGKLSRQDGKPIAIVRIKGFQEDTYKDMSRTLEKLEAEAGEPLAGIVLDLRNNPGGLLDESQMIADRFLTQGDIVYTVGSEASQEEVYAAREQVNDIRVPTVVLVNEGSASASEIVAGALKNNNRALVIGRRTFGKGSVQMPFSLRDGSSLKLTIREYLTPGRISIQAEGIVPDVHTYPVLITDEKIDVRENEDFSERQLDAHLENTRAAKSAPPVVELAYLQEKKNEQESQYTSKIRDADDYEIALALKLLARTTGSDKASLVQVAKDIAEAERQSEDKKITAALEKIGVDWTDVQGAIPAANAISVRYTFADKNGQLLSALPADTDVTMTVALQNHSAQPLGRVVGELKSFNPLIDGREFVIGTIAPGESKSAKVNFKVPSEIINFNEDVKLKIFSENHEVNESLVSTRFIEKKAPNFAYAYEIFDGPTLGSGNGNGIPEKGEALIFRVQLKNVGDGVSQKTVVNLKNTEGDAVFLEKARVVIGEIKPGSTASADLQFKIRDTFAKDDFSIRFFALDDTTKTVISDSLKFSYKSQVKADPQPKVLNTNPEVLMAQGFKLEGNRYRVVANVHGEESLKDISVFVQGRKIFFKDLKSGQKEAEVNVEAELKDGLNVILLQARGPRDMIVQKNLSVVYHDPIKLAKQ